MEIAALKWVAEIVAFWLYPITCLDSHPVV